MVKQEVLKGLGGVLLILLFVSLFLGCLNVEAKENFVVEGNTVYVDDDKAYIAVTPHTIFDSGFVFLNLTSKVYGGPIDYLFGFNTEIVKPVSIEIYSPWNQTETRNLTQFFLEPNHYKVNYTYSFIEPPFAYNGYVWVYKNVSVNNSTYVWNLFYEHSFERADFSTKIIYWNNLVFWKPLEDKLDIHVINYEYRSMNRWYWGSIDVNAGTEYYVRAYLRVIPSLGKNMGKFWVAFKPSQETLREAINNGHFYALDPWWDNSWSYYRTVTLAQTSGAGTNYQVRFVADYGSGSDSGDTFYLDGKCQVDFDDLRVVSSDDSTLYDSWLEIKVDSDYAIFWAKVEDDLDSDDVDLHVYYGNAEASNIWNGEDTFIFFDDATTDKSSSYTVEQGGFSYSDAYDYYTPTSDSAWNLWYVTGMSDIEDVAARVEIMIEGASGNKQPAVYTRWDSTNNNGYQHRYTYYQPSGSYNTRLYKITNFAESGLVTGSNYQVSVDTWYILEATAYSTSLTSVLKSLDHTQRSRASTTDATYSTGKCGFGAYYQDYIRFRRFFVRKYVSPEPTKSWGSEVTNIVYVTAYIWNGGNSQFRMNSTALTNGSVTQVINASVLEFIAIVENSTYIFLNFSYLGVNQSTNPHIYQIIQNITIWCYFGTVTAEEPTPYIISRFTFNLSNPEPDQLIQFNGSSSASSETITDYSWQFGDTETDSGNIVTHSYSSIGTYSINLTVTSTAGTDSFVLNLTVEIDITPYIYARFTWNISNPSAEQTVLFNGSTSESSSAITDYSWDWGDETETGSGETATHSYAINGTYVVALTVTSTDGSNEFSIDVTVGGGGGSVNEPYSYMGYALIFALVLIIAVPLVLFMLKKKR